MRVKHDSSACESSNHGKQGGTADNDSVPLLGWGLFYVNKKRSARMCMYFLV